LVEVFIGINALGLIWRKDNQSLLLLQKLLSQVEALTAWAALK
jgi:hypothetical protein